MKSNCPRLFEAEALRDGRLSGPEVARFQAHLSSCSACARESKALRALAHALHAPTGSGVTDELHVRRERTRLLAAFDARLASPPRRSRTKSWLSAVAAAAALCTLALVLWRVRPPVAPLTSLATTPDAVKVQADGSAKWSRKTENYRDTITLESGVLSIRVDHASAASRRRLLVILPDGELEDIGTTFAVTAVDGHTTQVSVQAGSIVLRLHGKPPLALGAGDAWSAAPLAVVSPPAPNPLPTSPSRNAKAPHAVAPMPSASASASALDPAVDFRLAMVTLNNGDNARAAANFGSFLSQYPRDSRAEDAAYLRVLALQRAGNSSAMKQAAADYLSRYPRGFRRSEIEPLSR